jgi:hypothetical protein
VQLTTPAAAMGCVQKNCIALNTVAFQQCRHECGERRIKKRNFSTNVKKAMTFGISLKRRDEICEAKLGKLWHLRARRQTTHVGCVVRVHACVCVQMSVLQSVSSLAVANS